MENKIFNLVKETVILILTQNNIQFDSDKVLLYTSGGLFDSMDLVNFISKIGRAHV